MLRFTDYMNCLYLLLVIIGFNVPLNTLQLICGTIFSARHLTGAKWRLNQIKLQPTFIFTFTFWADGRSHPALRPCMFGPVHNPNTATNIQYKKLNNN